MVGAVPRTESARQRRAPIVHTPSRPGAGLHTWLSMLRVHQWVKNLLVGVPLFTGFAFTDLDRLKAAGLAFLAFSLAASASYIWNDLLDLESDRRHPRKRDRPLASGRVPAVSGLLGSVAALGGAASVATMLPVEFRLVLAAYLVLTSAYSLVVKRYVLMDVVMLSLLYTLRIVAGSAAYGVPPSAWLLAFSAFIFLSLALVKRCSELVSRGHDGPDPLEGRGYRAGDLVVLWPVGIGAGVCALVVFAFFIGAPETQARYATPELLWLVGVGLACWLGRLWIKTARGELHDDPLVSVMKDSGSAATAAAMVLTVLAAYLFRWP